MAVPTLSRVASTHQASPAHTLHLQAFAGSPANERRLERTPQQRLSSAEAPRPAAALPSTHQECMRRGWRRLKRCCRSSTATAPPPCHPQCLGPQGTSLGHGGMPGGARCVWGRWQASKHVSKQAAPAGAGSTPVHRWQAPALLLPYAGSCIPRAFYCTLRAATRAPHLPGSAARAGRSTGCRQTSGSPPGRCRTA